MAGVCCVASSFFLRSLGDCLHRYKYLGVDASETKTEVCIDPGIYHCCKTCVTKRETRYIPQDLLLDILLHLPAKVLYDVMRHVSGEWNLMIRNPNFIYHHLRSSTKGMLIQEEDYCHKHNAIYVEMRRGSLEISKFDYRFEHLVYTSCNGLLLNSCYKDLYVINPSTNQRTVLPPYYDQRHDDYDLYLTFVEASMEYKLVREDLDEKSGANTRMQIGVLTVGVDKVWRHIDTKHLPLLTMEFINEPLVTEAYVHWVASSFVLTLNVETEIICWFPLPRLGNRRQTFLSMGNHLSIICESTEFFQDFWEMNPETGQWTMLLSFDLEPLTCRFRDLFRDTGLPVIPFGWLADREVLLFSSLHFQRHCVAYDIMTREAQSFELNAKPTSHNFRAHVNSLVRLEETFPVNL